MVKCFRGKKVWLLQSRVKEKLANSLGIFSFFHISNKLIQNFTVDKQKNLFFEHAKKYRNLNTEHFNYMVKVNAISHKHSLDWLIAKFLT